MKIIIESAHMPKDIEGLVRTYPCLADFGFDIDKKVDSASVVIKTPDGEDRRIECRSTTVYTPYIQLDTMDDLVKLEKAVKKNLWFTTELISFGGEFNGVIRIMDGY